MITPIETEYAGYRFRSRLEARWAVFFDVMNIKWEYEKEGYDLGGDLGYYLPDFWLPVPPDFNFTGYPNAGIWLEVKGQEPTAEEESKMQALSMLTMHHGMIVYGLPGEHEYFWTHRNSQTGRSDPDFMGGPMDIAIGLSMVCDSPYGSVSEAVMAAKQARFEHGDRAAGRQGRITGCSVMDASRLPY